jgi:excisionase family DNA binding protein
VEGVHPKTVRRLIASGKLRAHRIGRQWRISPAELERFHRKRQA